MKKVGKRRGGAGEEEGEDRSGVGDGGGGEVGARVGRVGREGRARRVRIWRGGGKRLRRGLGGISHGGTSGRGRWRGVVGSWGEGEVIEAMNPNISYGP